MDERNCKGCGASTCCDLDVKCEDPMPCNTPGCERHGMIPLYSTCYCVGTGERCEDCTQKAAENVEFKPGNYWEGSLKVLEQISGYWRMAACLAEMQSAFAANSSDYVEPVTAEDVEPVTAGEDLVEWATEDFHKKTPTKPRKARARRGARLVESEQTRREAHRKTRA